MKITNIENDFILHLKGLGYILFERLAKTDDNSRFIMKVKSSNRMIFESEDTKKIKENKIKNSIKMLISELNKFLRDNKK